MDRGRGRPGEQEAEWEKEERVRNVLEEISNGSSITDTILVPLMQANNFDVADCVDALLELINGHSPSSVAREQRELDEEMEFLRVCQLEASQERTQDESVVVPQNDEMERLVMEEMQGCKAAISAELKRTEELEMRRREAEAAEKKHFAHMRRELETEWMARLEQQQQELVAKQQQLEEERQKMLEKQLQVVSQQRSAEFKQQVEQALRKRMAETVSPSVSPPPENATVTEAVASVSNGAVVIELTCPETAEMGSLMTVYWEYKQGRPSLSDWIGYFKRSRSDDSKSYYAYQKTGGSEKGKLEFVVPSKLGMCEVRMFQNNDYKLVARSKPIRVGNSVQMRAELRDGLVHVVVMYADAKTRSSWDWVGLYAVGERDNGAHGGRYTYVSKDTVTLPAPKKPGSYVVRYFQSGSGLSELAESAPLAIADNDSVTVAVAGTEATVSWHIESVPNSSKDRIGVFKEGVFNPLVPVAMQQTHSNKADGVAKFTLPATPGRYEFVFIGNGTSHGVKKSAPFEVK